MRLPGGKSAAATIGSLDKANTDKGSLIIGVKQIYSQLHELDQSHDLRTCDSSGGGCGWGGGGLSRRDSDGGGSDSVGGGRCGSGGGGFKIKSFSVELLADFESEPCCEGFSTSVNELNFEFE